MFVKCAIFAAVVILASLRSAAGEETSIGSGTGFFVSDGWVVTNAHVLESCSTVEIVGIGRSSEWKTDQFNDLAAVKFDGKAPGTIAIRKAPARLGEDVAALGYPLATVLSTAIKITTGNVNSLLGLRDDTRYLQISAPIQPGNSGGPLVDQSGALLGVNTAVLRADATGDANVAPQNVNFAIRSSVLEAFLQSRAIRYDTAETIGTAISTADLAEKIAPAVTQIICFGESSPKEVAEAPRTSAPIATPPSYRRLQSFDGRDVIGFDYGTLRNVSHADCTAACESDSRCRAVTYNKRERFCFLKDQAAITVRNNDAIGSVDTELVSEVLETPFRVISGADQTGGDYYHIKRTNFIACFVACGKDNRCKAFAYVRKQNACWLKDRFGTTVKRAGVDLGVK